MHPASLRSELLRDRVHERGEVVIGRLLDLGDARGGRGSGARADRGHVVGRHRADLGPAVECGELHFEPARELALLRPDPGHLRAAVAGDHYEESRAGSGGHPQMAARDRHVDLAAALERGEVDPLHRGVRALAGRPEEHRRDPGRRDERRVGPERHADELGRLADDRPHSRARGRSRFRADLERLARRRTSALVASPAIASRSSASTASAVSPGSVRRSPFTRQRSG